MQLLTNISRTPELLPHFLRHYSQIGVSRFSISVDGPLADTLLPEVESICEGYDCSVFRGADDGRMLYVHRASTIYGRLSEGFDDGEWYCFADIDEFVSIPESLERLIADAESEGATAIGGTLVDRIAGDGSIPRVCDVAIEDQFPIAGNFTRNVLLAPTSKVIFLRWPNVPMMGHHNDLDRRLSRRKLTVNHYKWTDGVIEMIRSRVDLFASRPYTRIGQSDQRAIWYFDRLNGRFDLEDPRPQWRRVTDSRLTH